MCSLLNKNIDKFYPSRSLRLVITSFITATAIYCNLFHCTSIVNTVIHRIYISHQM